jgi:SprT protein
MPTNILPPHLVPKDIDIKISCRVVDCLEVGAEKTRKSLRFDGIKFFHRSSTAGYVVPSRDNAVYINLELYKKNPDVFLSEIIPHEVAHLFASKIAPKENFHGVTWKKVMKNIFGLDPIRCHRMDVEGVGLKRQKFLYVCNCMKHQVGAIKHKKIKNGTKYGCVHCKKELVFLSEV